MAQIGMSDSVENLFSQIEEACKKKDFSTVLLLCEGLKRLLSKRVEVSNSLEEVFSIPALFDVVLMGKLKSFSSIEKDLVEIELDKPVIVGTFNKKKKTFHLWSHDRTSLIVDLERMMVDQVRR